MPFQTGEFLAETAHLTTLQVGAYTLLLIHYWHKRGLPADDKLLARIARLRLDRWNEIRTALQPFFKITEMGWTNDALDAELAKRDLISAKRATAGMQRSEIHRRVKFRTENDASTDRSHLVKSLINRRPW